MNFIREILLKIKEINKLPDEVKELDTLKTIKKDILLIDSQKLLRFYLVVSMVVLLTNYVIVKESELMTYITFSIMAFLTLYVALKELKCKSKFGHWVNEATFVLKEEELKEKINNLSDEDLSNCVKYLKTNDGDLFLRFETPIDIAKGKTIKNNLNTEVEHRIKIKMGYKKDTEKEDMLFEIEEKEEISIKNT